MAQAKSGNTRNGIRALVFLGLLFGFIFLIPVFIDLFSRTQSGEGTRSGVVVKLSYKGRINSSWEGELMLGGVQSGQTWSFSLDPSNAGTLQLAHQLQSAETARLPITLHYKQRFIGPWATDTNYLVYSVESNATPTPH